MEPHGTYKLSDSCYIYLNHRDLTQEQKQQIINLLLAHRMYDCARNHEDRDIDNDEWKPFKQLSEQRSQLRRILRFAGLNKLCWDKLNLNLFGFNNSKVRYLSIQCENKEITSRMQELVSVKKNKKRIK
jgi:hypothetical protein